MIISVNWLKKYTDIDISIDELTELIGSRLVEIEEVIDLGKKYEGVVIAKVVECAPLEGSDHLNVTKIDDGGVVEGVERDENSYVQVVCGAPNVRAGLTVAWLPPKSVVPETYGKDEFTLDARKLRGVMSNGMLASAKELDLWDDHEGIMELEDERKAGESFAAAYELDDYLLDIENKSLTHRPDTFGIIGFAREVAGIMGKQFTTLPRMLPGGVRWPEKVGDLLTPKVTIDNPELSSRYQAVVLANVDSKIPLAPLEIQTYLARVGVRPHSAVVDVTNYMMMISGQPLHAFDYDKLKAVNDGEIDIHVRAGREGEKLVLLDEREIELSTNDIVIANGDTPVALAGAMGGRDTEIDENTTTVLLESASFNLYNLRNTQMRHGIFSEAITRFTKGQPAELTTPVLAGAVDLLRIAASAELVSDVADAYPVQQKSADVCVTQSTINDVLGSDFGMEEITNTLLNVGFDVDVESPYTIVAKAPYWRTDIHIPEDIIEEIGRLNGFDNIKPVLAARDFTAVSPSDFDKTRTLMRRTLTRAGANEVLTYSFVHGDLLKKAGQDLENSYRIVNSISPDLQYYRQSVLPSLLNLVHANIKSGYDEFALYELNKAHVKSDGLDDAGLPIERDFLAFVVASKKPHGASAFYEAKNYLEYLAQQLGVDMQFKPAFENPKSANARPFELRRSAAVIAGEEVLGIVGEFKRSVMSSFKLPEHTAGFVVSSSMLAKLSNDAQSVYTPLSRYPSVERDICFQVNADVDYEKLQAAAQGILDGLDVATEIKPVDIYAPDTSEYKNVTLRIKFTSYTKTLVSEEVAEFVRAVEESAKTSVNAKIV
ncbi:phenylalanine--tRNA ligase subunit beta [Candidatus Saccharibacteria bacterium]|nr:phenylalanine--tRNA ligase subunit beta [Candidatus Saccharibacteria bacterium]